MSELSGTSSTIEAVLQGGPATLPPERRSVRITGTQHVVKVQHYGGYEHFVRSDRGDQTGGSGAAAPIVFRWVGRTRIAE
ncbi:DUF5988 family protein [Streptomyces sp. MP131-18]|uniref:DUF5988 family protein n=1 Tax=Streptomyces sp. MP131-18 TaxID=1857892 RepID=UPI00097BDA6B|nr:DUF5988 family protein [Streptomyces sp. MP131-18]ONK11285.1 hypothetical protein STBA_20160 [Streptomyces sp. MP131-18]